LFLLVTDQICIAIRYTLTPDSSPYKSGFAIPFVLFLFYFGLWESGFHSLLQLILSPSWQHLYWFLNSKAFLILTIVYFGSVCVFYSKEVQDRDERLADYKRLYEVNRRELERCEEREAQNEDAGQ
jgi:hypothetical protein